MKFKHLLTIGCGLFAMGLCIGSLSAQQGKKSDVKKESSDVEKEQKQEAIKKIKELEDDKTGKEKKNPVKKEAKPAELKNEEKKEAEKKEEEELYAPPATADVKSKMIQWMAASGLKDKVRLTKVIKIWTDVEANIDSREQFDKVIESFQIADPSADQLIKACGLIDAALLAPQAKILEEENANPFYLNNIGLYYAHYLTQRRMYDEALDVFDQLEIKEVVDPATFLFDKAVCQHQLLLKEGLKTITKLLNNTEKVPVSYNSIATLMKFELEAIKKDSLDEIARKMKDSGRRLDLGRGGQRVQKVQGEIIASLDAIIKKMEEQGGGGGGGGGGGAGKGKKTSSSPAKESKIMGGKGPGLTDKRNLGKKKGWGALPEKDAARAKNTIGKKFPPHYIRAVEEYFKKQAERASRK